VYLGNCVPIMGASSSSFSAVLVFHPEMSSSAIMRPAGLFFAAFRFRFLLFLSAGGSAVR